MRKILLFPVLFLGVVFLSLSCKKEAPAKKRVTNPDETVTVKIAPNQIYTMDLTTAGSVTIVKQAANFLISETRINTDKGNPVYMYKPAADFTGSDEVVLSFSKAGNEYSDGNGGCQGGNGNQSNNKYVSIKITVAN